jgi:hypothetical protein
MTIITVLISYNDDFDSVLNSDYGGNSTICDLDFSDKFDL